MHKIIYNFIIIQTRHLQVGIRSVVSPDGEHIRCCFSGGMNAVRQATTENIGKAGYMTGSLFKLLVPVPNTSVRLKSWFTFTRWLYRFKTLTESVFVLIGWKATVC